MQPSKGLHNQVVKIVVPYCTTCMLVPPGLILANISIVCKSSGKSCVNPHTDKACAQSRMNNINTFLLIIFKLS